MDGRGASRRTLLLGVPLAAALAAGCGRDEPAPRRAAREADDRPLALVYRGPAACEGCAESAAALVRRGGYRIAYCGPDERTPIADAELAEAALYVQPGGGGLVEAWPSMRPYAGTIRDWVGDGGRYLGFCLGGYLAGHGPGFGLLTGDSDQYISSPGATVRDERDTVVRVSWRGRRRWVYFQDGALFRLDDGTRSTVLATYDNGTTAAVVTAYERGVVGVVGPHPEADASWYADEGLTNPDGVRLDLGDDLVRTTRDHEV